jgi:phosphoribosylamine--glycine ligase
MPVSLNDFNEIENIIRENNVSLVVVGPEEPLVKGLVDYLNERNTILPFGSEWQGIIGPSKQGAKLEGSKAFAKAFMQRHNIPTAAYKEFTLKNYSEGVDYLYNNQSSNVVLKADGLAGGKGVIICNNAIEAALEFESILKKSRFGVAGKKVIIEEFLRGIELSVFVLTDGVNYLLLPEAKDYKRIGEGDKGANTGGMGAISPVPFADKSFMMKVIKRIIEPTISGLEKENVSYKGFLFFGLMKVNDDPYVIEYNCRLGDPETEAILPRIQNDLVELLIHTTSGTLDKINIKKNKCFAASIVATSKGYPAEYKTGLPITNIPMETNKEVYVFHSGTKLQNGEVLTNGGRVVCVTALADQLENAVKIASETIDTIQFDGKYYRKDIGFEFLEEAYDE